MRILMLHNRYDIRGGEDESTDCEYRLLRERGHEIDLDEASNAAIGKDISRVQAAISAVWSRHWHARVINQLQSKKYDILHVQNFFPLISPSVYYAAHRLNVPVVQAIRNYRLICPSANLFRDGKICTDCVGTSLKSPSIRHACYRNSRVGTAAVAAMAVGHKALGTWQNKVSSFVAISEYVSKLLQADGFDRDQITVKPNFVEIKEFGGPRNFADRKHLLYVGRLTKEKGVDILLKAYVASGVKVPLKLVGEGHTEGLGAPGVEILGRQALTDVYRLMSEAYCTIMPGRWPEPFGRVAIESFACGTPVIASDLGGVAEIVQHGHNGFLAPAGEIGIFAARIRELVTNPLLGGDFASAALNTFRNKYSASRNYDAIMMAYQTAIARSKG